MIIKTDPVFQKLSRLDHPPTIGNFRFSFYQRRS